MLNTLIMVLNSMGGYSLCRTVDISCSTTMEHNRVKISEGLMEFFRENCCKDVMEMLAYSERNKYLRKSWSEREEIKSQC